MGKSWSAGTYQRTTVTADLQSAVSCAARTSKRAMINSRILPYRARPGTVAATARVFDATASWFTQSTSSDNISQSFIPISGLKQWPDGDPIVLRSIRKHYRKEGDVARYCSSLPFSNVPSWYPAQIDSNSDTENGTTGYPSRFPIGFPKTGLSGLAAIGLPLKCDKIIERGLETAMCTTPGPDIQVTNLSRKVLVMDMTASPSTIMPCPSATIHPTRVRRWKPSVWGNGTKIVTSGVSLSSFCNPITTKTDNHTSRHAAQIRFVYFLP